MKLAEMILTAREKLGLSQAQVADILGVSPSAVTQWETGVSLPTPERAESIAACLNLSEADVLTTTYAERKQRKAQKASGPDAMIKPMVSSTPIPPPAPPGPAQAMPLLEIQASSGRVLMTEAGTILIELSDGDKPVLNLHMQKDQARRLGMALHNV